MSDDHYPEKGNPTKCVCGLRVTTCAWYLEDDEEADE